MPASIAGGVLANLSESEQLGLRREWEGIYGICVTNDSLALPGTSSRTG